MDRRMKNDGFKSKWSDEWMEGGTWELMEERRDGWMEK